MDNYKILRKFLGVTLAVQDRHDYRQDTAFQPDKKAQYLSSLTNRPLTFDQKELRRLWGMDDEDDEEIGD